MPDSLLILATGVFTLFSLAFGACFGSFLNVLVWRMPRGMPIAWARSHCPKCEREILGKDNIPIFGWLMLRGKCRFCGLPISLRYPLIETAVGGLSALLFLLIVVGHGCTLPAGWLDQHHLNWLSEFPHCPLLYVYLHQFVLGYFLLAIALIDEDQQTTPWSLLITAVLIGWGMMVWNPAIGQMDSLSQLAPAERVLRENWEAALVFSAYGGLLGLLLGGLAYLLKAPQRTRNSLQSFLLLGIFLGPIVVLWSGMIAGSSLLVQLLGQRFSPRKNTSSSGLSLQLFFAWLLILCTWRWWPSFPWPVWL